MLKATSRAKVKTKKHVPGACSQGRAFLFGFIRRQPYFSSLLPNSFSAAPAAPIIPLTVGFFSAPATMFT